MMVGAPRACGTSAHCLALPGMEGPPAHTRAPCPSADQSVASMDSSAAQAILLKAQAENIGGTHTTHLCPHAACTAMGCVCIHLYSKGHLSREAL